MCDYSLHNVASRPAKVGDERLPWRQRAVFDGEVLPIVLLTKRKHVGETGGLDAGYAVNVVEYAPIEVDLFAIALVVPIATVLLIIVRPGLNRSI